MKSFGKLCKKVCQNSKKKVLLIKQTTRALLDNLLKVAFILHKDNKTDHLKMKQTLSLTEAMDI